MAPTAPTVPTPMYSNTILLRHCISTAELQNKTTILKMQSGLIFEVVLILQTIHVYMDMGLNQSGLISKVVAL